MTSDKVYAFATALTRLLLKLFFRRVEVTGLEHIPPGGGGVVVSWHPNGMIDPALIFGTFPRPIVFGARHGLFAVPLLGRLMRAVGTVPIFRAQDGRRADPEARRAANQQSLDALSGRILEGSFTCLFPEGDSHDAPHLLPLKTGVARFYYRSRQLAPADHPPPTIIPVGLHYDHKRAFRSHVLVSYQPPLALPPDLDLVPPLDEPEPTRRARWRALTDTVETALENAVHVTESWELHHLMHRARKLVRAERAHRASTSPHKPSMEERTRGFARVWAGYAARETTHPTEVADLKRRIAEYDADLRALGIEDHELDRGPRLARLGLGLLLLLQVISVYLLMPPILIIGALVNGPSALLLWALTRARAKKKKDEASIKLMAGALLFPLTWGLAGLAAGLLHARMHATYPGIPDNFVLAGVLVALLSFLGGALALRYKRLTTETLRAVRVRLTRERRRLTIARLKVDRGELTDALLTLADGLDLPGEVRPDGTIGASHPPNAPSELAPSA